jgi:hypothetical protein
MSRGTSKYLERGNRSVNDILSDVITCIMLLVVIELGDVLWNDALRGV